MIIAKLDIVCIAAQEAKTDPPLLVYADCVLPFPIAFEGMKSITGWIFQVFQSRSQVDVL